jgi:hypothetical protein
MPPLKSHATPTSEDAWDGPANEARLRDDENEAYYRKAYAWQDPDGDPETKAAYKFVHHLVDEDGEIGAASTRAATTGIAVLNGARGGTTIPDGDRQGVWDHLAKHLVDADIEPPELRSHPLHLAGVERRSFPLRELRVNGSDGRRRIEGYAAVFDVPSVPFWDFTEIIRPGAFKQTIQEDDIRALWNHEDSFVLGRNRAGTLSLMEDQVGLSFKIDPPEAQWASDFLVSIERGDVDQCSFRFTTRENGDRWTSDNGRLSRELLDLQLFEVSPVTFPAYPQTSAQLRSVLGMEVREFEQALERLDGGASTDADRRMLRDLMAAVQVRLDADPPGRGQGGDPDAEARRARLAHLERELELTEHS